MTDDHRDLIAGEALGALSREDAALVAELVARDRSAAAELKTRRATVAALEAGVARAQPSADLFERILAEVEPRPARTRSAWLAPLRRARMPRFATAGIAVAAAVALVFVVFTDGGRGEPDLRAAVAGTPEFADVTGEATLYLPDRGAGVLVLDLERVPPPPSGHHYELWVLRSEGGGAMEAVGSFTPDGERTRLELPLPGPGDYRAVDVSVEPDGGPAEHSDVSLAGGSFDS